jgi:pimeloyl-ACP methyl ester carboxylesterase
VFKRVLAVLVLSAGLCGGGSALAQAPAAAAETRIDYANPANWLCRPGRQDACTVNLDATVVRADGSTRIDRFHPDPNAPVDCFYVYPTVSRDPGVSATMAIEPQEQYVVKLQFARFAAKCRLFAPMYRQHTLTALIGDMTGSPVAEGDSRRIAYGDVLDAWNEYLAHDNDGRGVVLVGHSQGSGVLTALIAAEIDGKPVQGRLVSAILIGDDLQVPPGKDVGGSFKHIPLCREPTETGCAIAFSDFRADSPPPANSLFGQGDKAAGTVTACVNPAALAGGSGEDKAFLPTDSKEAASLLNMSNVQPSWTNPPTTIDTPFVELPGLITAECVSDAHGNYLAVTVHPTPGGRRINDMGGDVVIGGKLQPSWGLHLIDVNLTIGNLLDVVGDESRSYLAKSGR